jgi:oligoribonuclease (3'-5' exoribonuclease)
LKKAIDQAMYYSYTISKGFNISESLIYPMVVVASSIRELVERKAPELIKEASSKYNLRSDKASIAEIKVYCKDNNLEYKIMKITIATNSTVLERS